MERSQKNQRVNSQRDVHSRSGMDNTSNGIVLNLENANSDGNTSKILCAIYFSHGVVGTSIYDELSNVIYTDASQVALEDIDSYLIDLKIFCSPTLFIIHPSLLSNKSLLDVIAIGLDGEENFYRYTVLKSSLWNKRGAIELICRHLVIKEHRIGEERGTSSNFMMQKIATVVDLDVDQLCQTLGSLLHYMQENLFHLDDGNVTISSLKQLPTQSYMRVDTGSMKALQIFCEDIHPNVIKGVGRSKEGFSLFGLFDRTQSSSGRMKLKEWMAKPIFDLQNILYRQRGVEFFALETNRDLTTTIIGMMKHISDLPRMVLRIKKVEATHTEWCKLHTTCNYAVLILGEIVNLVLTDGLDDSSKEYLKGLICLLDISMLDKMRESLSKAIDFAESLAHGQIFIKEGFDSVLDQQRQLYDNLEEQLISAAHKILEVVPMLKSVSVEYVPQIGYLVAVDEDNLIYVEDYNQRMVTKSESAGQLYQIPSDEFFEDRMWDSDGELDANRESQKFEFVYAQQGIHYFKQPIVYQMDETIGDIKSDIMDRQRHLMLQIEEHVLEVEPQLQQLSIILATVDALISLSTIAVEQNLVKPSIVNSDIIVVKGGRHLLQQLTVDHFVSNDTYITGEKNIALITGPNASGKSIYLKQVGLIVYLAHIGSYVPCEKAIIGLTDRILTRITSTESVSSPHSAFCLDLIQISRMLSLHTNKSLCLIDEFGKGTSPVDGIALLGATVAHFVQNKSKALFALHFTEIFEKGIIPDLAKETMTFFCMETIAPERHTIQENDSQSDNDSLDVVVPLYKLALGIAKSSNGVACARSMGVPTSVCNRAQDIKCSIKDQVAIPILSTHRDSTLRNLNNKKILKLFLEIDNWNNDKNNHKEKLKLFKRFL